MYTPYNNISCITSEQFIELFGKKAYDNASARKHFTKHGYGGNGRVVYIEVNNTMRRDYREKIIAAFGPTDKAATGDYINNIVADEKAREFFKTFELDDPDPKKNFLHNEKVTLYTNEATILNTIKLVFEKQLKRRSAVGAKKSKIEFWKEAVQFVEDVNGRFPNKLPRNYRSLERKFERYMQEGYISLIGNYGNDNSQKITAEAGEWLIARYASMINRVTLSQLWLEYNVKAQECGWKQLKSMQAIDLYLNKPEIKSKWMAARYGELKYKETYTRQHRTLLPIRRDSIWYSDGTKLNYFYLNAAGKVETCNVYEVIDVYSEVLLGYHISKSEDFEAQYNAFKMAIQFAGHKPYELKFDNQGGHKKLEAEGLISKIAHLSLNTAPYNGKSKTIESIFGRFQSQFLHKDWFFTGQNINAVKQESKYNKEFIQANKNNLPTLDEVKKLYAQRRAEWNAAPHPKTGVPRIEMYRNSVNPKASKVEMWDIIDLFWLITEKPSTYRASGIEIQVKKEKYAYEVLTEDGQPDLVFLKNNAGAKFYVKYDPNDMTLAAIYTKDATGLRFVSYIHPYIKVHRAAQEIEAGEMSFIKAQELANKAMRQQALEETEDILEKHGQHPSQNGLTMPGILGVSAKNKAGRPKKKTVDVGKLLKHESMVLAGIDDDLEEFPTIWNMY
jgi:hypothetical protein